MAGRYRLLGRLGIGGMGTVWRADDLVLDRQVAVKELAIPPGLSEAEAETLRERTRREARSAARLHHRSAVTVYDVVEEDGRPWLVMELVEARTLAEVVHDDGPLGPQQAARVGLAVLGALSAAHERGIVHRDVKPSNVLIGRDGRVVLSDFGIATSTGDSSITSTGLLIGSPAYIAPERARGENPGPASDLWSLGATLFAAVEGRPPYDRGGPMPTLTAVVTDDREPYANAGPLVPVLDALLRSEPGERPLAADVGEMLREVVATPPTGSPSPGAHRQAEGDGRESGTRALALGELGPAAAAADYRLQRPPRRVPLVDAPAAGSATGDIAYGGSRAPLSPPPVSTSVPLPASPDDPRGTAPARTGGPTGRRRGWLPALAVLLAGALVLSGVALARRPAAPAGNSSGQASAAGPAANPTMAQQSDGQLPNGQAPNGQAPNGQAPNGQPPNTQLPDGQLPGGPPAEAQQAGGGGMPMGWTSYQGPRGWSVGVPPGWQVSTRGAQLQFRDPRTARTLRIDTTETPPADAVADWERQSRRFAAKHPTYRRIRIEPASFRGGRGADWEFTYRADGSDLHVLDKAFVLGGRGHALYWQVPAADWEASQATFQQLAASFQPA